MQQHSINNVPCDNARIQAACRDGSVYSLGRGHDPEGRGRAVGGGVGGHRELEGPKN